MFDGKHGSDTGQLEYHCNLLQYLKVLNCCTMTTLEKYPSLFSIQSPLKLL